ncbi:MAG: hypothetical protein ABI641_14625 [Caldimonas sp.]
MRASPPCAIRLGHAPAWRLSIALVAAASAASLGAWLLLAPQAHGLAIRLTAGLAGAAIVLAAASLARVRPGMLRWDGAGWRLEGPATRPSTGVDGELSVAVDLGTFMLLRFVVACDGRRPQVRWLPVERSGSSGEWHALRCAVGSSGPASTDPRAPA